MENNISWSSYWSALTSLTLIYYAYVLLVFYRHDLRNLLVGKIKKMPTGVSQPSPPILKRNNPVERDDDELFLSAQSLADETLAYLDQSGHGLKEEIFFGLKQIFKKHRIILNSSYQPAMESLLLSECEAKCAIHLTEEEVKQVWMG